PLNTSPLRNCAQVHTDPTVVNSFTVTVLGVVEPSTASRALASLAAGLAAAPGLPPLATRYRTVSLAGCPASRLKAPCWSDLASASFVGAAVPAPYKVTVAPAIGLLAA